MQDNKLDTFTLTFTRDEGNTLVNALRADLDNDDCHHSWPYVGDAARLIEKLDAPLEKIRLDEKRRDLEQEIAKLQSRV